LTRQERQRQGRKATPSAGCVDSQSIQTATQGTTKGYDGNKKVKGRKRHLLVDTLGLILGVVVTAANGGDREGLMRLLQAYFSTGVKRLRKLWVDGGYAGQDLNAWVRSLKKTHTIDLEVVEAEMAVRGDTATGVTKKVKTGTGLQVQVPAFVNVGDTIRVNTSTGSYVTRV
jgi:putative transposase